MKKIIVCALVVLLMACSNANAESVGHVTTNGLFAKDTIKVNVFDDPTIKGVSCYVTYYDRWNPLAEDSGQSSISCRQTGVISGKLQDQPNVFSSKLNIFFKANRVARFYDSKRKVLVYLSYTDKIRGKNKSHSVSVVPVK